MREIRCENCGRTVIFLASGSKIMAGLMIWSCPKCEDDTSNRYHDADGDDAVEDLMSMFKMK